MAMGLAGDQVGCEPAGGGVPSAGDDLGGPWPAPVLVGCIIVAIVG
jgi:hypothetical protein